MSQGPMARAVAEALRHAKPQPEDRAAVALAKRYAALIDEAAPAASYREPLQRLRALVNEFGPADVDKHLAKIEAALSAHTVASDLGPKLLAALTALGLTPAGRGAKGGGGGGGVRSKLDELRERRARRGAG